MNSGVVKYPPQLAVELNVPRQGQPRTVAQAATEMNVAKSTIRAWIAQRRLGHIRLGRSIRVPEVEIQRVLSDGYTPARRS